MITFNHEKTFRNPGYRIMRDKLDTELDRFEIKQETLRQFGIELDPDTQV